MVNHDRVRQLSRVLSLIPWRAVEVIEYSDPQYLAVKRIASIYGSRAVFFAVANALVSYRLNVTGEVYWSKYAEYLLSKPLASSFEDALSLLIEFLEASPYNRSVLNQKIQRLRRASEVLRRVYSEPEEFRDLTRLVEALASSLSARGDEKTIVFAAKMAFYAYSALGYRVVNDDKIPIPIDRRMAVLTSASRLLNCKVDEIMSSKCRSRAVEAWMSVASGSGIPSLHLDAVVWLPASHIEKLLRRGLEVAREEYSSKLVRYSRGLIDWSTARQVAVELIYQYPEY